MTRPPACNRDNSLLSVLVGGARRMRQSTERAEMAFNHEAFATEMPGLDSLRQKTSDARATLTGFGNIVLPRVVRLQSSASCSPTVVLDQREVTGDPLPIA